MGIFWGSWIPWEPAFPLVNPDDGGNYRVSCGNYRPGKSGKFWWFAPGNHLIGGGILGSGGLDGQKRWDFGDNCG